MENSRKAASHVKNAEGVATDYVSSAIDSALGKGKEAWDDLKGRGEDALGDVQERGEEAWKDAEKLVRKYPSKAIGIALFVGVLAGVYLTIRGRND